MRQITRKLVSRWAALGPRYMPFADLATPDLPLSRLIRLSLFQVSVAMTLVLLVGTLNRVLIVEMDVPAAVVAVMLGLPLLFAPFRALIGHKSDTHRCELGWRRVPFIWRGTMLQFGGFALMPFALLVLAGMGQSHSLPVWIGYAAAAAAFLLVGAGAHIVQTAGLALATDLTAPESQPKVVGMMYVVLLLGMIFSALVYGAALSNFSPGRLVQVIQGTAVLCFALNMTAMWKQETRRPPRGREWDAPDPTFRESWAAFCKGENAVRRLVVVGFGTVAFGMADVLLEPFGGQVLHWTVSATTKLTSLFAFGGLLGYAFASVMLNRGGDPYRMTLNGALIGIPAFALVILSAPLDQSTSFLVGNFLIGFGSAVFAHGTLTATMAMAPKEQAGLALGAWGAVQATAAGVAMAMSGSIRDIVNAVTGGTTFASKLDGAAGYLTVYGLEILLLLITIAAAAPLLRSAARRRDASRGAGRAASGDGHEAVSARSESHAAAPSDLG